MAEIEIFKEALGQYVPASQVISVTDTLRAYTVDGLLPRLLVTPANVEQVAHTVALANQYNLSVLARGGGSRMSVGSLPEQIDVLIETRSLTRILEHEAPDLTCHVEAGLTLAALQAQLAKK